MNSAIDGTTAGNLQSQINELENNALTTENIDNSTIVFEPTTTSGGANRLQVKRPEHRDGAPEDKSVTQAKLGDDVASYIQNVVKPQPGKDIGAYSWQELIEMANDKRTSSCPTSTTSSGSPATSRSPATARSRSSS